jgi:hypothetical protein
MTEFSSTGAQSSATALKNKFIEETRVANAIADTNARSGRRVFEKTSNKAEKKAQEIRREEFALELGLKLREFASRYTVQVEDKTHIENICELAKFLNDSYKDILHDGEVSFGFAQKALNVYLKYLWCSDGRTIPPHCPFDSIILDKIKPRKKRKQPREKFQARWTHGTKDDYRDWVARARSKLRDSETLPEWELRVWQVAQDKERQKIAARVAAKKPPKDKRDGAREF